MTRLSGPMLPPLKGGKPARLVVFCHGYGSNGADLIALAPYWRQAMPDTLFIAPNAPQACPGAPQGFQWFPITHLNPDAMRTGAESSAAVVNAFLDAELARHELTGDRLALVGFSQGTMMALHAGLNRTPPPAVIIGFSGALAVAPTADAQASRPRPRILLIHGEADERIPAQASLGAAQALGAAGFSTEWHISAATGHAIARDGLDLAGRFLTDAFT